MFPFQSCTINSLFQGREKWPKIPFTVYDTRHGPYDIFWLEFFFAGEMFEKDQSGSMEWDISALLSRFEDLNQSDHCPPYRALNAGTYLLLQPGPFSPNVSLCRKVVTSFEMMAERFGVREIGFTFGNGWDLRKYQGIFQIGNKTPPVTPPWDPE